MAYIWINPVVDKMYDAEELNLFLRRKGYERFYTSEDWLEIVRDKYKSVVENTNCVVADVRCPKMLEVLEEMELTSKMCVPDIKPILIHCGQEGSKRADLADKEKIITTPCQSLADMGNALQFKNTRFIPWNQFIAQLGEEPLRIQPKESPIPPGFFSSFDGKIESVTGEEEIRSYFANGIPEGVTLVELLYCKDGCHNGDGIRGCTK